MRRLLPLLLIFLGAFAVPADDAADIRATFDAYRAALLTGDGEAAVAVVDQHTLAYYDRMRRLARHGAPETLRALPTVDLLMVLTIRHRLPPDVLRAMDAPALLAHAVTEGWIGRDDVEAQTIGDVRIEGDTAFGTVLVHGQAADLDWTFHREDGNWRLDLTSVMGAVNEVFDAAVSDSDMDRESFIFTLLGMVTGTPPDETIWTPSDQR